MSTSGDKDFNQAPNTEVLDAEKMVEKYGVAAVLASGLVVDGLQAFDDLWMGCMTAQGYGEDISAESSKNTLKKDWVRRFTAFADKYLEGDLKKTEYCLKDAYKDDSNKSYFETLELFVTYYNTDDYDYNILDGVLLSTFFLPNVFTAMYDTGAIHQVLWSLGIEEQFYIFFPLLMWLLKDKTDNYLKTIFVLLIP